MHLPGSTPNSAGSWYSARYPIATFGDDPPPPAKPSVPLTVDEMWNLLLSKRGFESPPGGKNDQSRNKPATAPIDPRGRGPAIGPGYQTYAVVQIISADRKVWAVGYHVFSGGGSIHAEDGASQWAKDWINNNVDGGLARMRGGRMIAIVDQDVCSSCQGRLQAIAQQLELIDVEAYVPERPALRGNGMASPKTTMRTALSQFFDGKGQPIKVTLRRSFQLKFDIPTGLFKVRIPRMPAGVKMIGVGVVGALVGLVLAWLRTELDNSSIERQVNAFKPKIEEAIRQKTGEILQLYAQGKDAYANITISILVMEDRVPEPGGPPITVTTIPAVALDSVNISDQYINKESTTREQVVLSKAITTTYTFSFLLGVLD